MFTTAWDQQVALYRRGQACQKEVQTLSYPLPGRRLQSNLPRGGYFHIDIAEVHTAEGKLYLYVAIDRTSKFAIAQLVERANRRTATAFLEAVIDAVPYKIHTVLTDNGIQFVLPPRYRRGPTARYGSHMFGMRCEENGIDHRQTKVRHPWTNGQIERMNRTIKDATVKRYHYDDHAQLRTHLDDFLAAYNFARRLKTLKGLTPYEYICKIWTSEPEKFNTNPTQQMPGPNMMAVPGVGPIVALAYIATLDDEKRFRKSIDVGAFLGLTPKRYQSGEVGWSGKISKCGDCDMRRLLYAAASTLISCTRKPSRLKEWATKLAERKGHKKAAVAASRKIAVILHCLWRNETVFEPGMEGAS